MLIACIKQTSTRVEEERVSYGTPIKKCLFGHERLDVYQTSLSIIGELNKIEEVASCSSDLMGKLDKSSTSIVLNIAEGNGRFVDGEQSRFIQVALKAAVQSSALLNMAQNSSHSAELIVNAQLHLRRIAVMLTAWRRSIDESIKHACRLHTFAYTPSRTLSRSDSGSTERVRLGVFSALRRIDGGSSEGCRRGVFDWV